MAPAAKAAAFQDLPAIGTRAGRVRLAQRSGVLRGESTAMAARRKKRPLRPRVPSRVKKRRQRRSRSQHENELLGLALVALGLVFSAILYLGLDGGAVGSWLALALDDVMGDAAYVLPARAPCTRWAAACAKRAPGRPALPARGGRRLPRASRRCSARTQGAGSGWPSAARSPRSSARRGGDRGRRAPPRGVAPRDGRLDRSDPPSNGSRREAGEHGGEARLRLGIERVADRRGRRAST